jgi:hypothetical protein
VAEQDLNGTEIHARFQQVRCKGVPQRVRMNRFGNAGVLCGFLAGREDGLARDRLSKFSAGEQPILGSPPAPVDPQQLQQLGRQQGLPVLVALPPRIQSTLRPLSMSPILRLATSETLGPAAYIVVSIVR